MYLQHFLRKIQYFISLKTSEYEYSTTLIMLCLLCSARLWLPALRRRHSRWEAVHLRQWWIRSSGSKVNVQQDAAWKGDCTGGISCWTSRQLIFCVSNFNEHSSLPDGNGILTFTSIPQVSCGLNHTLVVSLDGMVVWAFGDGDYGKLGTGSSTAKYYPQVC